jgi:hypothetical protein
LVAALPHLQVDDFARHGCCCLRSAQSRTHGVLLLQLLRRGLYVLPITDQVPLIRP